MIGRTLFSYRILDKLGAGGMGEVYLAEDSRLGRRVALKVLPPEMAEEPQRLRRFSREARALAALNHPNIVTIYSVEEEDGVRFFTMEVVDGEPLARRIPEHGLPLTEFLELAVPVVEAVRAAHERGIAHRDLKPANVMISREGRVKVLDFGLAKLRAGPEDAVPQTRLGSDQARESAPADSHLTAIGQIFGTGPYMAPEQLLGDKVDQRSDLYSLGIVLFQMITGRLPKRGEKPPELEIPSRADSRSTAETWETRFPLRLRRAIAACLEKDRELRPSAAELYRQLVDLKKEIEIRALLEEGEASGKIKLQPGWRHGGRGSRGRFWRRLAPLAAAILLVFGSLWFFLPPDFRANSRNSDQAPTAASAADEVGRSTLIVLPFQNLGDSDPGGEARLDWLQMGLVDVFVTDLSQVPAIDVVSTSRLHNVLKRLDLLGASLIDAETVRRVAEDVRADLVLSGSFIEAGQRLRINVQLQDAESGQILEADRREGLGEESVFALVDELSRSLRQQFEAPDPAALRQSHWQVGSSLTSSVEAYRYYAEGLALHRQSKDQAAISLLEKAVEIDPGFAVALADLSTFHGNLGHELEADGYAERAIEMGERLPAHRRHFLEGKYYGRHWDSYPQAIGAYQRAIERYPDRPSSRSHLAILFLWLERYGEGIALYEEQIARHNAVAVTYSMMGAAHTALDRFDKAHQVLERYIRQNPSNWYAHMMLGWIFAHWEKFAESEASFERAEALRPGDFYIQNGRWRLYVLMEEWARSEEQAALMIAAHDPYARWRGHVCAARTALYRGRVEDAFASFAASLDVYGDVGPFAALSHLWLAEIHLARGEPEKALEEARAARRLAPKEWPELRGHFLEAVALAELGRHDEATPHQERLEELSADFPNVVETRQLHHLAGLLALARGELDLARRELARAVALLPPRGVPIHWHALPDHVPLWYDAARLEIAAGRFDQATLWLERIAESGVEHVEFPIRYGRSTFLLAELLEERGEKEARGLYRRFVELWGDGDLDLERVSRARKRASGPSSFSRGMMPG